MESYEPKTTRGAQDAVLEIRISRKLRGQIDRAARRVKMTRSGWLRELIEHAIAGDWKPYRE
jgi:predicted DNA-binding protein